MTDSCFHLARFGMPAESRTLVEFRDSYDCLVFNANSLAHMPGAVSKLVSDRTVKPYIVDPQTHAFQHDPIHVMKKNDEGEYELKKSIDKLANAYGPLVRSKAGRKAVVPSDFNPTTIGELAEGVAQFQLETVKKQAASEENREYLEWMGLGDLTRPMGVIAPYFFMDARTCSDWLEVNVGLAHATRRALDGAGAKSMYLELVIDRDILLDDDMLDEVATAYSGVAKEGIVLWVDSLSEHEAPSKLLRGLIRLLQRLRQTETKVFNLYGGYFSILLSCSSLGGLLSGVCHGMEYGEDRSVVPVGGGLPMAKYYVPSLHQRLRFGDAARLLFERGYLDDTRAFHREVCDCATCKSTINGNTANFRLFGEGKPVSFRRGGSTVSLSYPYPETKSRCLSHYLHRKQIEFARVTRTPSDELLRELEETADSYEGDLGVEGVSHLRTWAAVLRP